MLVGVVEGVKEVASIALPKTPPGKAQVRRELLRITSGGRTRMIRGFVMNESLYKNAEAKRHAAAIDRVAASTHVRPEEIEPLYERMLAKMLKKATIKTFLAIFTARRVERLLRRLNAPRSEVTNYSASDL